MGKTIARFVVSVAVLYGLAVTIFAFTSYPDAKPDVPTIVSDFHAWVGSLTAQRHGTPAPAPAEPPPGSPAPTPAAPAPATGTPTPVEPPTSAAEPGTRLPPEGLTGEPLELWRIENQVLPQAAKLARALRTMSREDAAAFEAARTNVMASLGDARTLLNTILERDSAHRQANRLWNSLQEIYQAVKKL